MPDLTLVSISIVVGLLIAVQSLFLWWLIRTKTPRGNLRSYESSQSIMARKSFETLLERVAHQQIRLDQKLEEIFTRIEGLEVSVRRHPDRQENKVVLSTDTEILSKKRIGVKYEEDGLANPVLVADEEAKVFFAEITGTSGRVKVAEGILATKPAPNIETTLRRVFDIEQIANASSYELHTPATINWDPHARRGSVTMRGKLVQK